MADKIGIINGELVSRRTEIDYTTAVADCLASPPAGFTWQNSGKLSSGDINTTTTNAMRLVHGTTASTLGSDCPFLQKKYLRSEGKKRFYFRLTTDPANSTNLAGLFMNMNATWMGAFLQNDTGTYNAVFQLSGGSKYTSNIGQAAFQAGVWFMVEIGNTNALGYYSTSTSKTPPTDVTDWTFLGAHSTAIGSASGDYTIGVGMRGDTSGTHTADFLFFSVE